MFLKRKREKPHQKLHSRGGQDRLTCFAKFTSKLKFSKYNLNHTDLAFIVSLSLQLNQAIIGIKETSFPQTSPPKPNPINHREPLTWRKRGTVYLSPEQDGVTNRSGIGEKSLYGVVPNGLLAESVKPYDVLVVGDNNSMGRAWAKPECELGSS